MRRTITVIAAAAALAASGLAFAAGGEQHIKSVNFTFENPFVGSFDRAQLQRGYKVYREVCASCHSMDLLSFRNLGEKHGPFYDPKYPNPNDNPTVKAIAALYEVERVATDTGDIEMQPATTADRFPNPYRNEFAARGGNGGAMPPDLSVIIKARHNGADYIYSLLTGYETPPAGVEVPEGMNYNTAFPGHLIAMKPPLTPGKVEFDDGTASTVNQQARDVVAFLAWASEPKQIERKQTGLWVMAFLIALAALTFFSYRRVWRHESH